MMEPCHRLQVAMASRLVHYGIEELDGSVIRKVTREFTQATYQSLDRQAGDGYSEGRGPVR